MFAARRAMAAGAIPPPTYSSVTPTSGKLGTSVTISGSNFVAGNTTVQFNNVSATSVTVTNSTTLTCVVPAASNAGASVPIKITTPSGTVTTGNVFTFFVAPTITSFSPASRTANTSGTVTINGTQFISGQTTVTVNGSSRTVTFVNGNAINVDFPALGRGSYAVVVTTPGGSASANYSYTITPTISSVSPSQPWVNTNYNFTVTGTNFISSAANNVYTDGAGYQYKGITVNSETSLTYNATYTATGTYRVDVVAPDGWSNQSSVTVINIPVPSISSVNDGRGGQGSQSGSAITISGSNLSGASVTIGGTAVSVSASATSISFTCPNLSTDGTKTINVTTVGGSASTSVYFWGAKTAVSTTYATVGSGTYSIPGWANSVDCVAIGGGQGGGNATGAGIGWGGLAGSWAGGSFNRTASYGTTTLSYVVGSGGTGATVDNDSKAGNAGNPSTAGSVTGTSAAATSRNTANTGQGAGNFTFNGVTYTGGAAANNANGNPPGGGGYGGTFGGVGFAGARGQVWFVARQ